MDRCQRSARFEDVRQTTVRRRVELSADRCIGHLGTVSAYLGLPPDVRSVALGRIRAVLPDRVILIGDLTLHLARLAG